MFDWRWIKNNCPYNKGSNDLSHTHLRNDFWRVEWALNCAHSRTVWGIPSYSCVVQKNLNLKKVYYIKNSPKFEIVLVPGSLIEIFIVKPLNVVVILAHFFDIVHWT